MQFGIRGKLIILSCLLISLSIANVFIIKDAMKVASYLLTQLEHTHDVILTSEVLSGQLKDAETGQRGYLLTGDLEYLQTHQNGSRLSKQYFSDLKSLTTESPSQQEILRQLGVLIEQKFDELNETIGYAKAGDRNKALQIVKQGTGRILMDKMRVLLSKFQNVEHELLIQRGLTYQKNQQQLELLFFVEVAIFISMFILFLVYIQRKIVRPLEVLALDAKRSNFSKHISDITLRSKYSKDIFNHLVSDSTDEIGTLSRALSLMHQENVKYITELELITEKLKQEKKKALRSSITDTLTGLYNRRKFNEVIESEWKLARREGHFLGLAMLDIDFFKKVNDTYGHTKGDEVLKQVAQCLLKMAQRPNDFVFRVGGEEFIFLTVRQDEKATATFVEEMRANIEGLQIPNKNSLVSKFVTISAGVVSIIPSSKDTIDDLLAKADNLLYASKGLGRNRVIASDYEKVNIEE